jgi:hypothetical protein
MASEQIKMIVAAPNVISRHAVNTRDIGGKSNTRRHAAAYTSAHTKSGPMNPIAMANNFDIGWPAFEN